MSHDPLISVQLINARREYHPGDVLVCEYQIDAVEPEEILATEASIMWFTEGKGDEDIGIHHFERHTANEVEEGDLRAMRRIEAALPNSPLSYHGEIVKINWCVRVRLFLRRTREMSWQRSFRLVAKSND